MSLHYKTFDHLFRGQDEYARAKYRITADWIAPHARAGMTLFNVGCGGGEYNAIALDQGFSVVACEPEAQAFALAKQNNPDPARVQLESCGLMELAATGRQADWLVMHDVLEHIEDETGAVQAISRCLRPGGRAVLSVPAGQWLFGFHDEQLGHFRRYSKPTLQRALEREFEIERIRYFGAAFIPITLWFSKLRRSPYPTASASQGFGRKVMRALCDFESAITPPIGTSLLVEVVKRTSSGKESRAC